MNSNLFPDSSLESEIRQAMRSTRPKSGADRRTLNEIERDEKQKPVTTKSNPDGK